MMRCGQRNGGDAKAGVSSIVVVDDDGIVVAAVDLPEKGDDDSS